MTKAEKRAAARIAAAKAARRRRVGQAIAGTVIVLLVVGGAFAGVWYFGDRAEKNRVKCKPAAEAAFPPLLGGMNKALATEPTITASNEEVKTVKQTILIKGDCKAVKAGQTVSVNYVGATMKDGKVFDSSWPRKKTIEIPVGQKQLGKQPQVIEGWDEGLVGLKIGTRVQLDIPGSKAYGDDAPEGYPAGTLRFIVDILDAKDADSSGLPAGLGG
ncbi:FKBP-type peptidyl-prolyl cis-trans isomerase [Dactylosporangium aurantiacum]|uniref:Peptidyl-prolyl cis-trans isomerase n=5 Tax=Dactylosporangium aurantiacum TaxID=35754 RepID=A0A9Q9IPJ0_9ACTN|nr:FKBP-type peptidyl-prolyl cis-trans isomerase [Dactylosporangium aurantiacum]UWZ59481.1 FKBP-type peptidyl-prolyl cis-trans isomerase [Dactylosporangium aurantiacum]